jgi:hypothetical protein
MTSHSRVLVICYDKWTVSEENSETTETKIPPKSEHSSKLCVDKFYRI